MNSWPDYIAVESREFQWTPQRTLYFTAFRCLHHPKAGRDFYSKEAAEKHANRHVKEFHNGNENEGS